MDAPDAHPTRPMSGLDVVDLPSPATSRDPSRTPPRRVEYSIPWCVESSRVESRMTRDGGGDASVVFRSSSRRWTTRGRFGCVRTSIHRARVGRSVHRCVYHSSFIGHRSSVARRRRRRRPSRNDGPPHDERTRGRRVRLLSSRASPSIVVVVNVVVVRIIESNAVPTFIHPRRQTTDGRRTSSSSASSVRVLVRARRRRPSRRRDERDERRSDDDRTTTSIGRRDRETDDAIVI